MNTKSIKSIIVAGSLATGLLSTAVAASAQTTAPAPTTATTANTIATTTPLAPSNANVSVSTGTKQMSRKDEMQKQSDEARRIEFRSQGTSL